MQLNEIQKNIYRKIITRILIVIVLSGFIFGIGFIAGQGVSNGDSRSVLNLNSVLRRNEVDFSLVETVWNLINEEYVDFDNVDKEELIYGAINGMLKKLGDPYTVFFNEKETKDFLTSVSGSFEGIGIEIGMRDGFLTVIAPLKNSPASRAGVKASDRIIGIDGQDARETTLEEAVIKIRGTKGTVVVLTVQRADDEELNIKIIRDTIEVPSVNWELLDDDIAYIELTQFYDLSGRDFLSVAHEILESSATDIILDLRNNPGGFLDVATQIAGLFIDKNETVVTEETANGTRREHKSPGPSILKNFQTVVLINEGSASASEILAGALRDHNDATIIGKKSFGKGSVQSLEELQGGTSLKLTVAKWITPSGQYINGIGIQPDIEVDISEQDIEEENDTQKQRAVEKILNNR